MMIETKLPLIRDNAFSQVVRQANTKFLNTWYTLQYNRNVFLLKIGDQIYYKYLNDYGT